MGFKSHFYGYGIFDAHIYTVDVRYFHFRNAVVFWSPCWPVNLIFTEYFWISTNSPFKMLCFSALHSLLDLSQDAAPSFERGRRSVCLWVSTQERPVAHVTSSGTCLSVENNIHLFKTCLNKLPHLHFVFSSLSFTSFKVSRCEGHLWTFLITGKWGDTFYKNIFYYGKFQTQIFLMPGISGLCVNFMLISSVRLPWSMPP